MVLWAEIRALSKSAAQAAERVDSRLRGNDSALVEGCHPREMPALAEAGAGVHGSPTLSSDFDGTLGQRVYIMEPVEHRRLCLQYLCESVQVRPWPERQPMIE